MVFLGPKSGSPNSKSFCQAYPLLLFQVHCYQFSTSFLLSYPLHDINRLKMVVYCKNTAKMFKSLAGNGLRKRFKRDRRSETSLAGFSQHELFSTNGSNKFATRTTLAALMAYSLNGEHPIISACYPQNEPSKIRWCPQLLAGDF